jgi:hypothetical protein
MAVIQPDICCVKRLLTVNIEVLSLYALTRGRISQRKRFKCVILKLVIQKQNCCLIQTLHTSHMLSDKNNLSFRETWLKIPNNKRRSLVKHERSASKFVVYKTKTWNSVFTVLLQKVFNSWQVRQMSVLLKAFIMKQPNCVRPWQVVQPRPLPICDI